MLLARTLLRAPRTRLLSTFNPPPPPAPPNKPSSALPVPRLALSFTCTVTGCSHRSTHQFTKTAYEKGVVIVQCPGCKNRHLIADHLGWFKDATGQGKYKTIEQMLKAKGESVMRGKLDSDGTGVIDICGVE